MKDLSISRSQGTWWKASVSWFPETEEVLTGTAGGPAPVDRIRQGFNHSLQTEIARLQRGECLVVVATFGNNSLRATLFRNTLSPDLPTSESTLSRYLGVEPWEETTPPQLDGFLELTPKSQGLPTESSIGHWLEANNFWATAAEQLASSNNATTVATVISNPETSQSILGAAARRVDRLEQRGLRIQNRSRRLVSEQRQSAGDWLHDLASGAPTVQFRFYLLANTEAQRILEFCYRRGTNGTQRLTPRPSAQPVDWLSNAVEGQINAMVSGSITTPEIATTLIPLPVMSPSMSLAVPRRHVSSVDYFASESGQSLRIGRTPSGSTFSLPIQDLTQHLLLTGLQGYGKSTTMRTILSQAWQEFGIPFLVIDPEKDDYADMLLPDRDGQLSPIRHLVLGQDGVRINPLHVPAGVNPLEYAAVLGDCFDAVSGLSEAFPLGAAVMRRAFADVYDDWHHHSDAQTGWPTMANLYQRILATVHDKSMGGETARNLRASLISRLDSLMTGANAEILSGGVNAGINWDELLSVPTVISLRNCADPQSRDITFSLILAGLIAYRRANPTRDCHIAVLEEAHMLLRRGNAAAAGSLAQALATQRAFGQAYALVTQLPNHLPEVVFDLFPTRISHRLNTVETVQIVAGAMGGIDHVEIASLQRAEVLAVHASGHHRATKVLVQAEGNQRRPHNQGVRPPSYRANEVVPQLPPERIWCSQCPEPCKGRAWLPLAEKAQITELQLGSGAPNAGRNAYEPALRSQALRVLRSILTEAAPSTLGTQTPAQLRVGLYCSAAKALTTIHAADRRTSAVSQRIALEVTDSLVTSVINKRRASAAGKE